MLICFFKQSLSLKDIFHIINLILDFQRVVLSKFARYEQFRSSYGKYF
jgi:hypothetical protein